MFFLTSLASDCLWLRTISRARLTALTSIAAAVMMVFAGAGNFGWAAGRGRADGGAAPSSLGSVGFMAGGTGRGQRRRTDGLFGFIFADFFFSFLSALAPVLLTSALPSARSFFFFSAFGFSALPFSTPPLGLLGPVGPSLSGFGLLFLVFQSQPWACSLRPSAPSWGWRSRSEQPRPLWARRHRGRLPRGASPMRSARTPAIACSTRQASLSRQSY